MNDEILDISGELYLDDHDGGFDILFLNTINQPLAEYLEEKLVYRNVTVRYWISTKECTKE